MKTLVACPIARHKLYSLELWAQATEGHERLMVLETKDADLVGVIEAQRIPALVYEPPPEDHEPVFRHRFTPRKYNKAYETIFNYAAAFGFSHVLSLQSDNIPLDADIVEVMESNWDDEVDFLVHLNPWRQSYKRPEQRGFEMGCTMASTTTWKRALRELPDGVPLYWGVYQTKQNNPRYHFTNKRIEPVEIQHLG